VSKVRPRFRKQAMARARAREVQGMFAVQGLDWPVQWRERWGRRANDLEMSGLTWRDAEGRAFVEVWNEWRLASDVARNCESKCDSGRSKPATEGRFKTSRF
jgi:hypothetical protein